VSSDAIDFCGSYRKGASLKSWNLNHFFICFLPIETLYNKVVVTNMQINLIYNSPGNGKVPEKKIFRKLICLSSYDTINVIIDK
jgi:hypothetical protein